MNASSPSGSTARPPEYPKRRFYLSVILFLAAAAYAVWPLDIIADVFVPLGFVDDVALLAGVALTETIRYAGYRKRVRAFNEQQAALSQRASSESRGSRS